MSYAFVKALTAKPNQSYVELLKSVRQAMTEGGYTQKPQLSACHRECLSSPSPSGRGHEAMEVDVGRGRVEPDKQTCSSMR